jgi:hypothetical protein
MSVNAGPYAAPPAAGPSTTESWGTSPEVRVMAANTDPTASRESTPSRSRAPPECQIPKMGRLRRRALAYAATIRAQPARPSAPPWARASEQNTTAGIPLMRTTPSSTPESSAGIRGRNVPGSARAAIRPAGERGSIASRSEVAGAGAAGAGAAGVGAAGAGAVLSTRRRLRGAAGPAVGPPGPGRRPRRATPPTPRDAP